jgi:AcrR family transcriptional regulator
MEKRRLNRPGTARYPKGRDRVDAILGAAKEILVQMGYGGLTMRNIASRAGTTVGNLQYYYPNKDRLLTELLEYAVHGFFEHFESIVEDPRKSPEDKLRAYVGCIFDAFPSEEKGKFYPEFWALSNHDRMAAELMENMYERGMVTLQSIIREINPKLTKKQVKDVAITIAGSVEGLVVFVGYRRPWANSLRPVRRISIEACIHMAKSAGRVAK